MKQQQRRTRESASLDQLLMARSLPPMSLDFFENPKSNRDFRFDAIVSALKLRGQQSLSIAGGVF